MHSVILLHGIGHHALAMTPMAWRLRKEGFRTLALTYTSLTRDIACSAVDHPTPASTKDH